MKTLMSGGKIVIVGGKVLSYSEPTVTMPNKGDIIKMNLDGEEKEYRVLKKSGSVVEVLTMWDVSTSTAFNSSDANTYSGGELDTYLNTTWYNALSTTAKNAIVAKNITQYIYQYYDEPNTPNTTTYTYQCQFNWRDSVYCNYDKTAEAVVGDRYVYVLDLEDIYDYYDKVCITSNELMTMFFNSPEKNLSYIWLRSACADSSSNVWQVYGYNGYVLFNYAKYTSRVRGAFQIDLSKIEFVIGD